MNETTTPISIGLPTFPAVRPDMALADFVGAESQLLFDLIGAEVSWVDKELKKKLLQEYKWNLLCP